ncbi:hypothetical protein K523DRAFT_358294 [Schizophyllum commune Tattone D]|nr:hypothetical protein K523DRAFT_358294 [Schizophyllum commune Tattone D]
MVVRAASGEIRAYPAVEAIHKHNLVLARFRSANTMLGPRAQTIADNTVRTFSSVGIFGVEMFLLGDGTLRIYEEDPLELILQLDPAHVEFEVENPGIKVSAMSSRPKGADSANSQLRVK